MKDLAALQSREEAADPIMSKLVGLLGTFL